MKLEMSEKEFSQVGKEWAEKLIEAHTLDESIEYILDSLKHTQYNQDAQDYFAKVMEHIKEMKVQ